MTTALFCIFLLQLKGNGSIRVCGDKGLLVIGFYILYTTGVTGSNVREKLCIQSAVVSLGYAWCLLLLNQKSKDLVLSNTSYKMLTIFHMN